MSDRLSGIKKTAYHEAGHAVAYCIFGIPFKSVTIQGDEDTYGHVVRDRYPEDFNPDIDSGNTARKLMEKYVMAGIAGQVAEKLVSKNYNWQGAGSDYHKVVDLASYFTGSNKQLEKFIEEMRQKTTSLLKQKKNLMALHAVAKELLKNKTLSSRNVKEIIRQTRGGYPLKRHCLALKSTSLPARPFQIFRNFLRKINIHIPNFKKIR